MLLYDDGLPRVPDGALFYPLSLAPVRAALSELMSERMEKPKYFRAHFSWTLRWVVGFFASIHHAHENAKTVLGQYRQNGTQYAVYLRSFDLGGQRLEASSEGESWASDAFLTKDANNAMLMADACEGRMACLSFSNPFSPNLRLDLYGERDTAPPSAVLPAFRVLDHNWQDVVQEVVRGANVIVMFPEVASEGVVTELRLVCELGLAPRSIVVVKWPDGMTSLVEAGFGSVLLREDVDDAEIVTRVRSLASDGFRQTRRVADLSDLPCHIVDRNILRARSHFSPEELSSAQYDCYLPLSLARNWHALVEQFPLVVSARRSVEQRAASGEVTGTAELAVIMLKALRVFVVACTLERYYEMAVSLATLGIAHRTITRDRDVMRECYEGAALFAGLSGDDKLAKRYRMLVDALREET